MGAAIKLICDKQTLQILGYDYVNNKGGAWRAIDYKMVVFENIAFT